MYFPNTTWTTGRNHLYEQALRLSRQHGWKSEYLIFADDDSPIIAVKSGVDPYSLLHAALRNVRPAVASPAFGVRNLLCEGVAPCTPNLDATFAAFHITAAPLLLPYDGHYDRFSWGISQGFL